MKSSAAGGRGARGADFFRRRGVAPPREAKKLFTSFTDGGTFCATEFTRTHARRSHFQRSFFGFCVSLSALLFGDANRMRCVQARRASLSAAVVRLAARSRPVRCPLVVAINTRVRPRPSTSDKVSRASRCSAATAAAASERRRRCGRAGGGALCGQGGLGLKPPKDKTYK